MTEFIPWGSLFYLYDNVSQNPLPAIEATILGLKDPERLSKLVEAVETV